VNTARFRKGVHRRNLGSEGERRSFYSVDILPALKDGDSWLSPSRFLFHRSTLLWDWPIGV